MTNNDATRTRRTADVHAALDALRKIKAPTKRAAFVAATLVALRTQDEVIDFVRQIRLNERVQDVALLPDTLWTIERSGSQVVERTVQTSELLTILAESECPIIDFPNILFHYGFIVTFTKDFEHFIARSADYGITETYMSM